MAANPETNDDDSRPYVIFYMRHHNDIDYLSPVAYKLNQTGRAKPVVVVMNPFHKISDNYRLKFLSEQSSAT